MLAKIPFKLNSINPKKIHKLLQESTQKIKHKQTVTDFDKMQAYVKDSVFNNKLGGMINKTARLDSKLDSFMNDFQVKNKEPTSVDTSQKPTEDQKISERSGLVDLEMKELLADIKRINDKSNDLTYEDKIFKFTNYNDLSFTISGEFKLMVMDQRMTTNTTSLRRINKFKVLVWGGNMNGVVGYGKARGINLKGCYEKAIANFKENVIAINLDLLNTCPRPMYAKFGKYKIVLWSRKYNNAWGSPTFSSMLQLGGLRHCMFKFYFDRPNPYSLVYCLMKLFTSNTTPKLLAEQLGTKLYDTCWSKRKLQDYDMDSLN